MIRSQPTEKPRAQRLRAFVERIERLEEERKTLADDIGDVYKELAADGFDKDAAKVLLKIRKAGAEGLANWTLRSATVDEYLVDLGMVSGEGRAPAPARTRENITEFPVRKRADGGADIRTRHTNIAGQGQTSPADGSPEAQGTERLPVKQEGAGSSSAGRATLPPHDAETGELMEVNEPAAIQADVPLAAAEPAGVSAPAPSSDLSQPSPLRVDDGEPAAGAAAPAAGAPFHHDPQPLAGDDGHPGTPTSDRDAQNAAVAPAVDHGGADAPGIVDKQSEEAVANSAEDAAFRVPVFLSRQPAPAEPKLNEKCQRPTECRWAYSLASCSRCNHAWLKQKEAQ